jgi:hypothetical protein
MVDEQWELPFAHGAPNQRSWRGANRENGVQQSMVSGLCYAAYAAYFDRAVQGQVQHYEPGETHRACLGGNPAGTQRALCRPRAAVGGRICCTMVWMDKPADSATLHTGQPSSQFSCYMLLSP